MIDRLESDIKKNWQYQLPLPLSVVCITYNHEKYIADAIEGFLVQETNFPFEIIIHDDASVDNTQNIILDYARRYPKIIKPICAAENQYSQRNKNVLVIAASHAQGKYIAICEGDDYWIDKKKLQIQFDEMQKFPQCNLSYHPFIYHWVNKANSQNVFARNCRRNAIFFTKDVITRKASIQSSSVMIKKHVFENLPEWFYRASAGDFLLQILASHHAGVLYINKVMSLYRGCVPGSWSEKVSTDECYAFNFYHNLLDSVKSMNQYFLFQYQRECDLLTKKIILLMCRMTVFSNTTRKKIYKKYKDKFNFANKLIWFLVYRNEFICETLRKIKRSIKK